MHDSLTVLYDDTNLDTGYISDDESENIFPPKHKRQIVGHDAWLQSSFEICSSSFEQKCSSELLLLSEKTADKSNSFVSPNVKQSCKHDDSKRSENCFNKTFDAWTLARTDTENNIFWKVISQKDKDGDNLLLISIILLDTHVACMLIDLAPSHKVLNCVNKLFQTALHLASLTGNYPVARRLLVAGAKVDKRDFRLNTALHMAVKNGFIKVAEQLTTPVTYTEAKRNIYEIPYQKIPQNLELFNSDGETCLHIAARTKNKVMIDLLIKNEADVNARELKSGKTILHYFAETDDVEMVKYLVAKSKIDLNATTYCGITAAELAHSKDHFAIAYLLISLGGNDPSPNFCIGDSSDSGDSDYSI